MIQSRKQRFYIVNDGEYLFIRYSNDGGTTFTSNDGLEIGAYEGFYISSDQNASLEPTLFTWNLRENPYQSDDEPSNPYIGMQWADTSSIPVILKIWDGDGWNIIADYHDQISNLQGQIIDASSSINQNTEDIEVLIEKTTINVDGTQVDIDEFVEDMKITLDGIENTLSKRDGNNVIRDSIGCFNDGAWSGNYDIDSTNEVRSRNQYGYAILLKADTLSQLNNVSNGDYTLSFVYKKHINLSNVKLIINDVEFQLTNTDYTSFSYTFSVTTGIIEIYFESDTDDACTIINLMINKGTEAVEWSLNPNETWSDTVKIGRGVRISSSGTTVEFVAYADNIGFQDKEGNYITTFDYNGMITNEVVVKNKATIVKLLIQDINNQTVINRLNEEVS